MHVKRFILLKNSLGREVKVFKRVEEKGIECYDFRWITIVTAKVI